jgi:pyruvate/2-oxoglutarate dehydrogenase complex dihydrolipoamide acyltransferase (E2) component
MSNNTLTIGPYPKMRNFVLDTMSEGRKKNTVYAFFDIDITDILTVFQKLKSNFLVSPSITSYISRCYSKALTEHNLLNSYRKGRHQLMFFDDVDIAVMIEKEIEGALQPIHYIIRSAQNKSLYEIDQELKSIKAKDFTEIVKPIDRAFFKYAPLFLRKLFWWLTRKDPKVKKEYSGTVGLTNIGMFGEGQISVLPITPMTTTLAIGTISKRLILTDLGELQNRNYLHCTLCVDHDIVDGSPMTRFAMTLKNLIESGFELESYQFQISNSVCKHEGLKS